MSRNNKNKEAKCDSIVSRSNADIDTPVEILNTKNKEYDITDINNEVVGKRVLNSKNDLIEEYFFVTVKRADGSTYVPTEATDISNNLYIEGENADNSLYISPAPDNNELEDTKSEDKSLTAVEVLELIRDETPDSNPLKHKISKLLNEVIELL